MIENEKKEIKKQKITKSIENLRKLDNDLKLENNDLDSVLKKLKKMSSEVKRKFDQSLELNIGVNLNPKENVVIRGPCELKHEHKKNVKILVFAEGSLGEAAKKAGADLVGGQELIEKIKNRKSLERKDRINLRNYDICIATEGIMRQVSGIANVLGGKKIMPNKKDGTLIVDNESLLVDGIEKMKKKTVLIKADKKGYVSLAVGKISEEESVLADNVLSLISAIKKLNTSTKIQKGSFFKKAYLSTTMGLSLPFSLE